MKFISITLLLSVKMLDQRIACIYVLSVQILLSGINAK